LWVVTAEVDGIGTDSGLKAGRRVLGTGGSLGEGDKSLRAKAETGKSETTHRKAIARDIVPFSVRLKRWLSRLHERRRGRGRLLTLFGRLRQGLFSSALILSKPRRRGRTSARSVAMLWTLSVLIRQRARHHSFSLLQKLRPHTRSPGRALPQPLQPRRRSPSALPLPATRSCVKGRRSPSRPQSERVRTVRRGRPSRSKRGPRGR